MERERCNAYITVPTKNRVGKQCAHKVAKHTTSTFCTTHTVLAEREYRLLEELEKSDEAWSTVDQAPI